MLILCDTAHRVEQNIADMLVFNKSADSVDFAPANRVSLGDIVITQDYGLTGMRLARGTRMLNQNGMEYTAGNIDGLPETVSPKPAIKTKSSSVQASTQRGLPNARGSRIFNLQRRWRRC